MILVGQKIGLVELSQLMNFKFMIILCKQMEKHGLENTSLSLTYLEFTEIQQVSKIEEQVSTNMLK